MSTRTCANCRETFVWGGSKYRDRCANCRPTAPGRSVRIRRRCDHCGKLVPVKVDGTFFLHTHYATPDDPCHPKHGQTPEDLPDCGCADPDYDHVPCFQSGMAAPD